MTESKKPARRTFLAGLLTGAGAVAALSRGARPAAARAEAPAPAPAAPVLYRRTEDVERYYRTLYR